MKIAFVSFLTLVFLSIPFTETIAWGGKGHRLVAQIAFRYLDDTTQKKVRHYLNKMTIEDAATWMDDMRSDDYYNYMRTWHYINLKKDSIYKPVNEGNTITVLNSIMAAMKHKEKLKDSQIKNYIVMAFHLIGDLHQPLHNGYPEDRGGNSVEVKAPGYSGNLHSFWDGEIIENKKINLDSCTKLYSTYSPEEIAKIQRIDLLSWMYDARSYLTDAYNIKDSKISQAYIDQNAIVVEKQLFLAGLRLASFLKEIFN